MATDLDVMLDWLYFLVRGSQWTWLFLNILLPILLATKQKKIDWNQQSNIVYPVELSIYRKSLVKPALN